MKDTKAKTRFTVLIEEPKLDSYGESCGWSLSIVRIDPTDEKPRNCSRHHYDTVNGEEIFDDLVMRVHFSWFSQQWSADSYYTEYRSVYSVDLQTLEVLTKGLKKVQKITASFPIRPESFGQYVCLLAAGLGVKEMVRKHPAIERRRESSSYLDSAWQILPISSAQRIIDEHLDAVREKVIPTVQAA